MAKEINTIKRLTNNFLKQHQIYTKKQIQEQTRIGNVIKNLAVEENKIPAKITTNRNEISTNLTDSDQGDK